MSQEINILNKKLNAAANRLEGQPMFKLLDRIKALEQKGKDIIHFEIGDPDFATPEPVVDSCIQALRDGQTHYVSSFGLEELREAVADYTVDDLGFRPRLHQILISPGANALIYFVIQCLVKSDEEVIVPDPAFSTYYSVLHFLNIKAVGVELKEENDFRMNPEDIRKKITPKTKLIIINSPHNPTGAVMTQEEINAVYQIAAEHDLFILSDEIYRRMSYDAQPASPCINDGCRERTIMMTGFSKAFAMTGWRLGYMIGPEFLVEKISLLLQTIVSCVPPFIQKAGVTVLKDHLDESAMMLLELKARKDLIVDGLNQIPGISCLDPQGAFYVFPNIKGTGLTSEAFAELMLKEGGVALLPGCHFGRSAEGYVRLCFAQSIDDIHEGLSRMRRVLKNHSSLALDPVLQGE